MLFRSLVINNIQGNFVVGNPTIGSTTNANYVFGSYQVLPPKVVTINTTPKPNTATANSHYTYNTTITEYNSQLTLPTGNTYYVTSTGVDYGQVRGYRVQLQGVITIITGATLSDGVNTRTILGTQADGANATVVLVDSYPPARWINNAEPLTLTYKTP